MPLAKSRTSFPLRLLEGVPLDRYEEMGSVGFRSIWFLLVEGRTKEQPQPLAQKMYLLRGHSRCKWSRLKPSGTCLDDGTGSSDLLFRVVAGVELPNTTRHQTNQHRCCQPMLERWSGCDTKGSSAGPLASAFPAAGAHWGQRRQWTRGTAAVDGPELSSGFSMIFF